MTDSIQLVDDPLVSRIHGNRSYGKLHKGHHTVAATSSIPSKYQTVVVDNCDKRGFHSTAKRFQYDMNANDNPGPGNYMKHSSAETQAPSFSKRGTGGLAIKEKRSSKRQSTFGPSPASYNLPGLLESRKDYSQSSNTRTFTKPIAIIKRDVFDNGCPGPNVYDVSKSKTQVNKTNNVSADAAFKSKSRREMQNLTEAKSKPSPCQYNVVDTLTKDTVRVPFSSFKSTSNRHFPPKPDQNPGPGDYKPNEAVEPPVRTLFPRKHYLCISAPAMALPDTPPPPGPGAYDLPRFEGATKHYMSGSMFVSTTSRWAGGATNADFPSPAHYKPVGQGKQSFIYNANSKWI